MLKETVIFQYLLILKSERNPDINYADNMSVLDAETGADS